MAAPEEYEEQKEEQERSSSSIVSRVTGSPHVFFSGLKSFFTECTSVARAVPTSVRVGVLAALTRHPGLGATPDQVCMSDFLRALLSSCTRVSVSLVLIYLSIYICVCVCVCVCVDDVLCVTHQNQSDRYKRKIGATGGRPLDPKSGLKPHDAPVNGLRGPVSTNDEFGNVSRGNPLPYRLSAEALEVAGLTESTWKMKVTCDKFLQRHHVKRAAVIERENMTFTISDLEALAKKKGVVRYMKMMQCLNIDAPLGQGVWEGVKLSDVLNACGAMDYVRRINYFGFHNNEAGQRFRSSLSYSEVFEPVPNEPPVIVACKLNGQPLAVDRGGPVRMIVPSAHGFKSVKWLIEIQVTNDYRVADTYAVIDKIGAIENENRMRILSLSLSLCASSPLLPFV